MLDIKPENSLTIAFTNKVVVNAKNRNTKYTSYSTIDKILFREKMSNGAPCEKDNTWYLQYDVLQIDEYSQIKLDREAIYKGYRIRKNMKGRSDLVIQIFGDKGQCQPVQFVEEKQRKYVDIFNKQIFKEIVGYQKVVLKYFTGDGEYKPRYGSKLNDFLTEFRTTGNVPDVEFKPIDEDLN